DGVALLHADGDIVYANDTFLVLAQRGDAFRTTGRTIEFATHGARRLFEAALGAVKKSATRRTMAYRPISWFHGGTECRHISSRFVRFCAGRRGRHKLKTTLCCLCAIHSGETPPRAKCCSDCSISPMRRP